MIVVHIDYWPHGNASQSKRLHAIEITNDGTQSDGSGDSPLGSYVAWLFAPDGEGIRSARIEGYARKEGALRLVQRALEELDE